MLNLNYSHRLRPAVVALAALTLCGSVLADEAAKPTATAAPMPSPKQPKRAPRPGDVQRVFVIRHVKPRILGEVLAAFPATITYSTWGVSSGLGVSAAPAVMAAIEETIKRLDAPEAPAGTVELTAYVIEALAEHVENATVPPQLDSVVTELRKTFRYASYRLVDTVITRAAADGRDRLEATSISEADIWPQGKAKYGLRALPTLVTTDGQRVVRMEQMDFTFSVPIEVAAHSVQWTESRISTHLDIRDGQTVVVGKSGTGQPGSALILVLNAKIID